MLIGLISDTHGLLRPEVHVALAGAELILHAGDVGGDEILDELEIIAPVRAVSGNTDASGNHRLAPSISLRAGGLRIHISHGHELGVPKPGALLARYDADIIVYGHTHIPRIERAGPRLVVNPGAAGPARFEFAPSVALLMIADGVAAARIIALH